MEVSEVIQKFKESLKTKVSEITVKNYISDINHFIDWTDKKLTTPVSIESLSKSTFLSYIETYSGPEASDLSRKSFKRHISSLRAFSAFLMDQGLLTENPFEKAEDVTLPDPWKLSEFKTYLFDQKAGPLTIKYYINDVQSYIKWCKETNLDQVFADAQTPILNDELIQEYARRLSDVAHLSPKSINRKLSSLRRYASFRSLSGLNSAKDLNVQNIPLNISDTIQINEIETQEQEVILSKFPPLRFLQRAFLPYSKAEDLVAGAISSEIIKTRMHGVLKESKKTPKTRLESFVRGLSIRNIPKEFYAPHELSLASLPFHKKVYHHLRYTRPKWYKTYHNYSFVHYVHFGVLAIFALFTASILYNNTLGSAGAQNSDTTKLASTQKTFSFQGRLLDKNGNPLTSPSDIRLLLYSDPTASGSALLWEEVQNNVTPDNTGYISLLIGAGNPIPEQLTLSDEPLYLGVSIGNSEELIPRKQLGEAYAKDSGKLFGMLPITRSSKQTNVVLALDGQGDLTIGGSSDHTFKTSGGDFTLTGETLILSTNPGASGNVVLAPYGNGKIDLQKALISTSGIIQAEGTVEIHATTSASPALSLKQDSAGDLLSASTAGSTKFVINNQGVITKGIWAGEALGTEFGGLGSNISATGAGEILYSTGSRSYASLKAGNIGDCLVSQGRSAPIWSACNILSTLNGATSLSNNSVDFVLGGSSTASAKFAFINMTSNNPIFKIAGTLSFSAENGIENHDKDLKLGGNTTKNVIVNTNGNFGIKNANPTRTLDVLGSWGGNVDSYIDTDTSTTEKTITRDAKALIYDLQKITGSTNTSTTTTYNIVGIPEVDGTIAFIYTKVKKLATSDPVEQKINVKINGGTIIASTSVIGVNEDSEIKHFMVSRSNGVWHLMGNPGTSDAADLAEWTEYEGTTPLPGMIVSIGSTGKLKASNSEYDKRMAGVITTNPNITIGGKTPKSVRLALAGRIPTVVTSVNGEIIEGDSITSSIFDGVGMKLSRNGPSAGKALERFQPHESCIEAESISEIVWPYDDGKNTAKPCFKIKVSDLNTSTQQILLSEYGLSYADHIYIGKVLMLANLSWSQSEDLLASLESISMEEEEVNLPSDGDLTLTMQQLQQSSPALKIGGKVVTSIGTFSKLAVGKIKAGSIIATNIGANNLSAASAIIGNLTVSTLRITDSLLIDGMNIKDYIAYEIQNKTEVSSPLAQIDTLQTNTISPKDGNNITVSLPSASDSALVIKNAETGSDVIKLQSDGTIQAENATLSGNLASNTIQTNNATISGTLHADKLVANEITGLDDRLASIATSLIKQSKPQENSLSESFDSSISQASVSAGFGTFYEGLLSLGASTFGDLSVMDTLSVGTSLTVSPNSINTLGVDLEIQPLRQGGISFMAGAVKINIDGTLAVFEDALFQKSVTIAGRLSANVVSPLPNHDLSVNLSEDATNSGRFTVTNASNSAVLAINSQGNIHSSGSGTFSKINFNLVGQAVASGQYEAVATGSAGTAILKKATNELTILNQNVTQDSLIYITPAQETQNQVLYLMRQRGQTQNTHGSFTVGISGTASQDILFNWLIVN